MSPPGRLRCPGGTLHPAFRENQLSTIRQERI
jgi:hypothetical protein